VLNETLDALRNSPRPVKLLLSRVLWRTRLCRLVGIQRNGYRLRFSPSAVSANLWAELLDTSGDEGFLQGFLRPGQTVGDVGANVGTHSLFAALQVGESGRVYALEAHPVTAKYLRDNICLNSWIQLCGSSTVRLATRPERWSSPISGMTTKTT
jgi:hypothetical protein